MQIIMIMDIICLNTPKYDLCNILIEIIKNVNNYLYNHFSTSSNIFSN